MRKRGRFEGRKRNTILREDLMGDVTNVSQDFGISS